MSDEEYSKMSKDAYNKALESKNKYIELADIDPIFDKNSFWGKNTIPKLFNLSFGETFLYQVSHWDNDRKIHKISYPKIAMHVETLPCDQTVEFRFVDRPRTWMWNVEYLCNANPKYSKDGIYCSIIERGSEINSVIPWGSCEVYIFGKWTSVPDWKQMKMAYEKTIWFYTDQEQLRDRAISALL
jgi:hypothetical protein